MTEPTSVEEARHNERMAMPPDQRQIVALEAIADKLPGLVNAINGLASKIATTNNLIDKKLPT